MGLRVVPIGIGTRTEQSASVFVYTPSPPRLLRIFANTDASAVGIGRLAARERARHSCGTDAVSAASASE